ncbi:MAG TPA: glycosyltransferase family protein [Cellvibrionaceae bacterium]|nr:glycosyltransferase family protein [Cellvibrionaceae bacterium]
MKILYGVQGTGNGHIARARALNRELNRLGADIDFIFSGRNPADYFALDDFPKHALYQGLRLAYTAGKVDIVKTWQQNNLPMVCREINTLDTRGYDLVISDFEPITAWAAKFQGTQCLTLGHQYAFNHLIPKADNNVLSRHLLKAVAPSELALGLHWYHFNQPILPPIIQHLDSSTCDQGYYLVYLPFEDRQDIIDFLEPFEAESFICFGPYSSVEKISNILFRPCSAEDFHPALCGARGVICNAGFELTSEALQLGIKLLVKPLQGQMEQVSNARALVELGLGLAMSRLEAHRLHYWLNNFQPRKVTYPNVARAIATWIMNSLITPERNMHSTRENAGKSIALLADALWSQTDFSATPWLMGRFKYAA